jgi:hypothetical protein
MRSVMSLYVTADETNLASAEDRADGKKVNNDYAK